MKEIVQTNRKVKIILPVCIHHNFLFVRPNSFLPNLFFLLIHSTTLVSQSIYLKKSFKVVFKVLFSLETLLTNKETFWSFEFPLANFFKRNVFFCWSRLIEMVLRNDKVIKHWLDSNFLCLLPECIFIQNDEKKFVAMNFSTTRKSFNSILSKTWL